MWIEFLHEWGVYGVGQVVDCPDANAEILVLNYIARPAGGPVQPTTATTTAVGAPMTAGEPKKPRGGPKKLRGR